MSVTGPQCIRQCTVFYLVHPLLLVIHWHGFEIQQWHGKNRGTELIISAPYREFTWFSSNSLDYRSPSQAIKLSSAKCLCRELCNPGSSHYNDVKMSVMAFQITSLFIVYSTAGSGTDERKHQSSASPSSVRRIHRWPINSPHKSPVTRKCLYFLTSSCVTKPRE